MDFPAKMDSEDLGVILVVQDVMPCLASQAHQGMMVCLVQLASLVYVVILDEMADLAHLDLQV